MGFMNPQDLVVSSAILLILLSLVTPLSHALWNTDNHNIKEASFLSPKFELSPGSVVNKFYYDLDFPRGHIVIKSFSAEAVDEQGNPIPLYETYLHHWLVKKYHQHKSDIFIVRNSGVCQNNVHDQFFGFGSESRGTSNDIPDPFGVEAGNPAEIPDGYEEKWMINVHAIDLRGVEDKLGCAECRRDLYNVTLDEFGQPLRPDYIGGIECCYDNTQCRVKQGFEGPKRSLYMKYTVKWVEWNDLMIPGKIYALDVTDTLHTLTNDPSEENNKDHCLIEYDVEPCRNIDHKDSSGCIDVRRTTVPMKKGGYVIFAFAHQHTGGIGSTLYGQDGRVICSSTPTYGNGKDVGNEAGYLVGMSTCYPQPGSVKIFDGEILTLESNYSNTQRHVGVMGLFYLLLAEKLPHHHQKQSTHFSRASLIEDVYEQHIVY